VERGKKSKMIKHVKNSKSETLNSKQYQNPNAQNRKEEKGLGHLNFGNLNLFRIWDLEFRICSVCCSWFLTSGTLADRGQKSEPF